MLEKFENPQTRKINFTFDFSDKQPLLISPITFLILNCTSFVSVTQLTHFFYVGHLGFTSPNFIYSTDSKIIFIRLGNVVKGEAVLFLAKIRYIQMYLECT